jgi:hypothetical protein
MTPNHPSLNVSLALAVFSACAAQSIQNPDPPQLIAQIIASARDIRPDRDVVVNLTALARVPRAFNQTTTPDALRTAVVNASTDTTALRLVCPSRAPCHLPGNPLLVRIDEVEVSPQGHAVVRMTLAYNRGARRVDSETLVRFVASSTWKVISGRNGGVWRELSRDLLNEF